MGDRISELFDIIVDYPDSKAALWDLKVLLLLFFFFLYFFFPMKDRMKLLCLFVWFVWFVRIFFTFQFCLSKTDQKKHLSASLKASFQKRLLHPGANTNDILSQYVSTIKALKDLDPSGVLLENVGEPIRLYLRYLFTLLSLPPLPTQRDFDIFFFSFSFFFFFLFFFVCVF